MIILYSLSEPQSSHLRILPLTAAYLAAQPLYLIFIYRFISRKCCKSNKLIRHISLDTLNETIYRLREPEAETLDDKPETRQLPI